MLLPSTAKTSIKPPSLSPPNSPSVVRNPEPPGFPRSAGPRPAERAELGADCRLLSSRNAPAGSARIWNPPPTRLAALHHSPLVRNSLSELWHDDQLCPPHARRASGCLPCQRGRFHHGPGLRDSRPLVLAQCFLRPHLLDREAGPGDSCSVGHDLGRGPRSMVCSSVRFPIHWRLLAPPILDSSSISTHI